MLLPVLLVTTLICHCYAEIYAGDSNDGDICSLPRNGGSCYAGFVRYYYDAKTAECKEFIYGRCGGNDNNFWSLEECQARCGAKKAPPTTVAPTNSTEHRASIRALNQLVSRFRELTATEDVFESLEKLDENSAELAKLAPSIGFLLQKAMDPDWEADGEEEKALADMHELFAFPKGERVLAFGVNGWYEVAEDDEVDFSELMHVKNKIFGALRSLTGVNRNSTDTASTIIKIKDYLHDIFAHPNTMLDPYFNGGFYNVYDINTLLRPFNHSSILGCRKPTTEEMAKYKQVLRAFDRMEKRNNITQDDYFWDINPKDMLALSMRSPKENAVKFVQHLDKFNKVNPDSQDLYNTLYAAYMDCFSDYIRLQFYSERCKQEETFVFQQTVLLSELNKVHRDLLRLVLVKASMGYTDLVQYFTDTTKVEDEVQVAIGSVGSAGRDIAQWARGLQDLSWFEIGTPLAKEAVGFGSFRMTDYDEVARKVQEAFEKQLGSKNYIYQVLVLPTSTNVISWGLGSVGNGVYTNILDYNGIDIHIFRCNWTQVEERASSAEKWMEDRRWRIMQGLGNGGFRTASTMMSHISSNPSIGPIYGEKRFRSVIIVRFKQSVSSTKSNSNQSYLPPFGLDVRMKAFDLLESETEYPHYSWKAFFFL